MYTFQLKDGHLIAEINGNSVLVDTGSPVSIGNARNFTLNGQDIPLQPSFQNIIDVDGFSALLGFHIDIVFGADALNRFDIEIDAKKKKIEFHEAPQPLAGTILDIDYEVMGIPILHLNILGTPTNIVFDSGAKLSYIHKSLASEFHELGEVEDFYAGIGRFMTMTYAVPVVIGDVKFNLTCGVLPQGIDQLLTVTNAKGILGSEIFGKYSVMYAPRRRKICFIP